MPILWPLKVPERGNAITTQPGHYRFFLIPQKIPTQIKLPKKILAKCSYPKKFRNRKFQTQNKSFDHPRHLKSRVPPPGAGTRPIRYRVNIT